MSLRDWIGSLGAPFQDAVSTAYALLPRLVLSALVLLLGLAIAWALRLVAVRLLERGRRLLTGRALPEEETDIERLVIRIVGALVFALVILIASAVAVETLGLSAMTATLSAFARYLPRIIAAVLEVAAGIAVGNIAAAWVSRTARAANIAYARAAANAVKSAIVLVAAVVALTQAGIDSTILVVAVGTFLGAFLGSAALAFGLGARTTVSNLIAAHYLQRTYRVNQRIRIGQHEGRILELKPMGVLLETTEGVTLVPAKTFSEETSVLLGEES